MTFKVGDRVTLKYAMPTSVGEGVYEVTSVRGDLVGLNGNPAVISANICTLVWSPVDSAAPDVAKLQAEANEAWFRIVDKIEAEGRTIWGDNATAFDATVALQAALQPPEVPPVYLIVRATEFVNKALTIEHIRKLQTTFPDIVALFPWDGTNMGDSIVGDELTALLAGEL